MTPQTYPSSARGLKAQTSMAFAPSLLLCALLVAVVGYLRLVVYPDRVVPLAYGLPLLVCLWNRDLRLLYGMAVIFSGMGFLKVFHFQPQYAAGDSAYEWFSASMIMVNIWVVVGVVHGLIVTLKAIEEKNRQLEITNAELEATNEELATREEEITQQNEELQSQAEELEQQAEELRQTSEETEQQAGELQTMNAELARQERALRTLLESARWIRSDISDREVMAALCQAAVQLVEDHASAAAIVQEREGAIMLRGDWGFGVHGTLAHDCKFSDSFASLVMESGRTAFLADVSSRPDLRLPQPLTGRPFRSVMATPIWAEGKPIGAVELYAHEPREWTEDDFRIIEWVAAQAALTLKAVDYQHELELKRREAVEASVQKTRFLAAVSHDVRTPANAISLLAELIESTAQNPDIASELPELARDLRANARSLVDLVSDVLDLARFDAGKQELQLSEFELRAFVEAELQQSLPVARARGIRLISELPDRPVWIRTDRMKLARVLSNLVGNAIKFTEEGTVRVAVSARADGLVEMCVVDTGIGVAPGELPCIFDEFYQLRNPARDRTRGAGLGLAICRRLVEALGCSISVDSVLGEGSTFCLRLPSELILAEAPASRGSEVSTRTMISRDEVFLKGVRILLVEDHEATRLSIARLLEARGAVVIQAPSVRSAMHALTHDEPSVLLLDLMLPDQDGTHVLEQLTTYRPASLKWILAVSGDVRPERVQEVTRLGANGLLAKPIKLETLLESLRTQFAPTVGDAAPAE